VRHGRWLSLFIALGTSLVALSCRNRDKATGAAPSSLTSSDAAPAPPTSGSLPEDPDAGARSAAEWHEHLAHEERERRLGYDRRKLHEHENVLKKLRGIRQSYDAAKTKPAVMSAYSDFKAMRPKLDALFDSIDHYGVSSKVLPDYRALVETFSDAYPTARIAAVVGDPAPSERVGREVDERFRTIDAWLHEAEESEDE